MAEYVKETKTWLDRSKHGDAPYCFVTYDHGVMLLSVVTDSTLNVRDHLSESGFARWRAVNETTLVRRMRFVAKSKENRIVWDQDDPRVSKDTTEVKVVEKIPCTYPDDSFYKQTDWAVRFLCTAKGPERIRTECGKSFNDCSFEVEKAARQSKSDVVIVTALAVEYQAVRDFLAELEEKKHEEGTIYETGKFKTAKGNLLDVAILEAGVGNIIAAIETERASTEFVPALLMMVGVGGGVKDVKLGDVVTADIVHYYEKGKDTEFGFNPRSEDSKSSYRSLEHAKAIRRDKQWLAKASKIGVELFGEPRTFIKPIATGEAVVAGNRSNTAKFIEKYYGDAILVEMEGSGFLEAVYAGTKEGIVIRGVSDLLKEPSEIEETTRQEIAARNAAAFAFEILYRFY